MDFIKYRKYQQLQEYLDLGAQKKFKHKLTRPRVTHHH